MKSILDKNFKYVPAVKTNIRETFERIRKEIKEQQEKVKPLPRKARPWTTSTTAVGCGTSKSSF